VGQSGEREMEGLIKKFGKGLGNRTGGGGEELDEGERKKVKKKKKKQKKGKILKYKLR